MIKKSIIILLTIIYFSSLMGQVKTLTVAPLGLVNKVRIKYEQQLKRKDWSIGSYLNIYYAYFQGLRIDPFVRFYFFSENLKGLYLQLKLMGGIYQSNLEYHYYTSTDTLSTKHLTTFYNYGGGPAIGYQWYINDKIPLDVFAGFNINKMTAPRMILKDNQTYDLFDDVLWYSFGPGSIIHLHVGIGVRF
ncbi:MAG: DUF3575 domain-containing protein [Bacteroidales bacterium]|nr:DUF3575 domain-containing protein [Bacteroidales bacterium]